jgi:hypothetical protein
MSKAVYVLTGHAFYTDGPGGAIVVSHTQKGIIKWVKENLPNAKRNRVDAYPGELYWLDEIERMNYKCDTTDRVEVVQ